LVEAVALALFEKLNGADRLVDDSFVGSRKSTPSALGVRDGRNKEPQSAKDRQFATSSELHMDAITKNCKAAPKIK
jgi:hypothetical protein